MYRPLKEKVVKFELDGVTYYIFPRIMGITDMEAESIVQGAVRGRELTFQIAHTGTDRNTPTKKVNIRQVSIIENDFVAVPTAITDLYEAPNDSETEEEASIRIKKVEDYFEIR